MHKLGIHQIIADLSTFIRPRLIVLDAYGCSILGIDPYSVPYIVMAEKMGIGRITISPHLIYKVKLDSWVSHLAEEVVSV